jgi:hypothetical protein
MFSFRDAQPTPQRRGHGTRRPKGNAHASGTDRRLGEVSPFNPRGIVLNFVRVAVHT